MMKTFLVTVAAHRDPDPALLAWSNKQRVYPVAAHAIHTAIARAMRQYRQEFKRVRFRSWRIQVREA